VQAGLIRHRAPGMRDAFLWAVTNPLGIGLPWVRELWLERRFPPELAHVAEQFPPSFGPLVLVFISAGFLAACTGLGLTRMTDAC